MKISRSESKYNETLTLGGGVEVKNIDESTKCLDS